ncbi:hypothetical protein HAX54_026136, partial [Datura stramonium]|nr:hypothetical protein [Datura stramonium]
NWNKKAGFKPNLKTVIDESPSIVNFSVVQIVPLDSLLKDAVEIKASLCAVADDLHKIQVSLSQVASATIDTGEEIAKIRNQLTLLQYKGVKSFNLILTQVDFGAARAKKDLWILKTGGASPSEGEPSQKESTHSTSRK